MCVPLKLGTVHYGAAHVRGKRNMDVHFLDCNLGKTAKKEGTSRKFISGDWLLNLIACKCAASIMRPASIIVISRAKRSCAACKYLLLKEFMLGNIKKIPALGDRQGRFEFLSHCFVEFFTAIKSILY